MLLLEKKVKCPLCGAKNPVNAARCGICTRPLRNDPLPTQAVYQEALWSTRIASKGSRKKSNPYALLAMTALLAALLNYFVLGYGPSWAHVDPPPVKGATWRANADQPGYTVDLPGSPIQATTTSFGTPLDTATVWVDSNWATIRDARTQSVADLDRARRDAYAGLVTATGPAPTDAAASLTAVVTSLAPGAVVEPGGVTRVQDASYGEQFTLDSSFTGWPEPNDQGHVRATAIVLDGKIYVAASFVRGKDDKALHARLAKTFIPTAAPTN